MNQSHFFQYLKDDFITIELEEPDREFKFAEGLRDLSIYHGLSPSPVDRQASQVFLDGNLVIRNYVSLGSFNFFVYDVNECKFLESLPVPGVHPDCSFCPPSTYGTWLSNHSTQFSAPRGVINFTMANVFGRYNAIQFIENIIPDDAIVMVYSATGSGQGYDLANWATDTVNFPTLFPRSLYEIMEQELGANLIRDFADFEPYILFTQKGNPSFPRIEFSVPTDGIIDTSFFFECAVAAGVLRSVNIGPALEWDSLDFEWHALEEQSYDDVYIELSGLQDNGATTVLFENIDSSMSLSSIDAEQYPNLRMDMYMRDDTIRTAPQLDHWRIFHDKVPEAAVNPQLRYAISADTIDIGQSVTLETGITNISTINMDSLLVKLTLNRSGTATTVLTKRFGTLAAGESLILDFELDFQVLSSPGDYIILLEANPDSDQPEQFHFNNYATFVLSVEDDRLNPLLDITFDGEHILDGDIISPRPEIIIKLKDENKGLALKDTSSFEVYIYYPDAPEIPVLVDPSADNVNFVPADEENLDEINEAYFYYYPDFVTDGIYRLKVQGEDARNNQAGDLDYLISFEVVNESTITHFMNYPNPFSNSTRFVFTLTGAEIPDDIKIQIMTISGSVVREITMDELGSIKIGRNITEFTWDGTDRYGDKLANGLYIYKVFTKLNGETIKQRQTSADKYFGKEDFGKMYIVR